MRKTCSNCLVCSTTTALSHNQFVKGLNILLTSETRVCWKLTLCTPKLWILASHSRAISIPTGLSSGTLWRDWSIESSALFWTLEKLTWQLACARSTRKRSSQVLNSCTYWNSSAKAKVVVWEQVSNIIAKVAIWRLSTLCWFQRPSNGMSKVLTANFLPIFWLSTTTIGSRLRRGTPLNVQSFWRMPAFLTLQMAGRERGTPKKPQLVAQKKQIRSSGKFWSAFWTAVLWNLVRRFKNLCLISSINWLLKTLICCPNLITITSSSWPLNLLMEKG
mmetsp:Transcript_27280/g.53640  ORF Transcript_27280/g.53640 Transcript_27280/m.53640 type:complete len:276 (-) Transcript_27280:3166-3993(-)